MKINSLFLSLGLFLAACNSTSTKENAEQPVADSTAAVSDVGAPKMAFVKDVYDFGKIKAGEKVIYDFEFTNTGSTPLIIKEATATCGCTVPEIPKEPIAPGASAKINVVFNSEGKSGMQDKVVTITANTVPAQTQIHLVGEVEAAQ